MSGSTHNLFEAFPQNTTLDADFSDLVGTFPSVGGGNAPAFEGWDANFNLLSSAVPLALSTAATDLSGDRDIGISSSEDDGDVVDLLGSQLTALNQRVVRSMRSLVHPGNTPLKVSSPQVDEAFKDTNNLMRIISDIATISNERRSDSMVGDGLTFLALASHQHLLALFKAICDSINRCLDLAASTTEQQQPSLYGDGTLCLAQFVMVLQLLLHLINRMDRGLFPSEGGTSSGGQITPLTPTSHPIPMLFEYEESEGLQGLPNRAHVIVRTIPDKHVTLRRVIQELQARIERSEIF